MNYECLFIQTFRVAGGEQGAPSIQHFQRCSVSRVMIPVVVAHRPRDD
jgi:hypothetical protein